MVIIDEIEFLPPSPPVHDILGGAGTYAAVGARLFSPPPQSSSVGWVVDKGRDFPEELTALIDSWDTSALCRSNTDRLTTRGWNGYEQAGNTVKRAFRYTTPKNRLTAQDLTPAFLLSKSFHLICSPTRCKELVTEITSSRKELCPPDQYVKPIFVWEPVPDLCTPEELLNCTNTLPLVDVCSPNHAELAGFMGEDGLDPDTGDISTVAIERSCEQLLASMPLRSFSLVIRAGDQGCYIARNGGRKRQPGICQTGSTHRSRTHPRGGLRPDTDMEALLEGLLRDEDGIIAREEIEFDPGLERWIPAYHQDPARVVDPTGGGNSFLGGLSVALARGFGIEEAAIWGSMAASLAIEQVGMPNLGKEEDGSETWNGIVIRDRLDEFRARIAGDA
ncbi:Ribokinase-like protein [Sodiomyces alkalinus F11]|uniref:Ribokinase-like protein n=1 Tax=Sodiomyces alkalinus (strain CBS 110278 / VKM F-3762 / F11) TaxID=1314773 RepID=A0A3N2PKA4_SODAK|nr:Ribokinase-like protein [Sodiomyces alkalinus F11]ROT34824.1 Ribokinase-like protein [Sodiomyces alkalinus F11]